MAQWRGLGKEQRRKLLVREGEEDEREEGGSYQKTAGRKTGSWKESELNRRTLILRTSVIVGDDKKV